MAAFPPPFGSDFPNLERGLTENVPVLCTLLVAFVGLLFVTVATLHDIDKSFHQVTYRPFVITGPSVFSVTGKNFGLWIAGLDCLFFYLSVLSIIFARMSQYRDLVSTAELSELRKREPLLGNEMERLDRRRHRYVTSCMICFNLGILSLPAALLPIADKRAHQSIVIDLLLAVLVYSFWVVRERLLELFRR